MNIPEYMNLLHLAENLKNSTRHCWTSAGRRESVAEHCWRLTFMAFFLQDEFPEADINRVIEMCIFHDIGEAFTGDIPAFVKTEGDSRTEEEKVDHWIEGLPPFYGKKLAELFAEMKEQKTEEARIYKALDKMEAVIQHNESGTQTWLPLEYDLQFTYGEEQVQFSSYFKELKCLVNEESRDLIAQSRNRSESDCGSPACEHPSAK